MGNGITFRWITNGLLSVELSLSVWIWQLTMIIMKEQLRSPIKQGGSQVLPNILQSERHLTEMQALAGPTLSSLTDGSDFRQPQLKLILLLNQVEHMEQPPDLMLHCGNPTAQLKLPVALIAGRISI